jgi:hypothetical protein
MSYQRILFGRPMGHVLMVPAPFVDMEAETLAWVAEVVDNGGTVSEGRQTIVNTLIAGLKADGIWTKLDRLWLFAAENSPSALTDLVGLTLASETGTPTFTVDEGYTGSAGNWVSSNFAGSNLQQDSASLAAWSLSAGQINGAMIGTDNTYIIPRDLSDQSVFQSNTLSGGGGIGASTDGTGFWHMSRTASNLTTLYRNGSSHDTSVSTSTSWGATVICFFHEGGGFWWPGQTACGVIGDGLDSTESSNLYTRLQTYLTAVGL